MAVAGGLLQNPINFQSQLHQSMCEQKPIHVRQDGMRWQKLMSNCQTIRWICCSEIESGDEIWDTGPGRHGGHHTIVILAISRCYPIQHFNALSDNEPDICNLTRCGSCVPLTAVSTPAIRGPRMQRSR